MLGRRIFEGNLKEQFEAVRRRLDAIELLLSSSGEEEEADVGQESDGKRGSDIATLMRLTGEQISARMDAASVSLDRLQAVEARLHAVERSIAAEHAKNDIRDEQARDAQPRAQPTSSSDVQTPLRPAPIDYTPVIQTALQMFRELGVVLLQQKRRQTTMAK